MLLLKVGFLFRQVTRIQSWNSYMPFVLVQWFTVPWTGDSYASVHKVSRKTERVWEQNSKSNSEVFHLIPDVLPTLTLRLNLSCLLSLKVCSVLNQSETTLRDSHSDTNCSWERQQGFFHTCVDLLEPVDQGIQSTKGQIYLY